MRRGTKDSKIKILKKPKNWCGGNKNEREREREVVGHTW